MKEKAIALFLHENANEQKIVSDRDVELPITFEDRAVHQALTFAKKFLVENCNVKQRNIWGVRLGEIEFAVFDMTAVPQEDRCRITPDLLPYPHVIMRQIEIDSNQKIAPSDVARSYGVVH